MGHTARIIAAPAAISLAYAEAMLKDVTPAMFARQPVINNKHIICNHPAWVYGHLSIYSSRCMELLGLPLGVTAKPDGFDDLFKNGTECKDDPAGTIYPSMEKIVSFYTSGYKALLAALPEVSDEVLSRPTPMTGRMAELLPTVGAGVAFLISGHPMSHLGQISTWRRCMGLGSAM